MNKNYKMTGTVEFCGKTNEQEKNTIILSLGENQIAKIRELIGDEAAYDGIPLKETEDGRTVFKSSSKFDVTIYDDGTESDEIQIENIGKGSTVQIFFSIGESVYKRKHFCVAYLKAINVIDFVESTKFNPFEEDSNIDEL